ncbi:MAG: 30S ribosomal protein S7 [Deltaproteobacteria bacterium]|nr:30S ribosomal protein S7 [Deltaproteobacteria bacterium]
MGRRKKSVKREICADALFQDYMVGRFINRLMQQGKKSVAENIFYAALDELKKKNAGKDVLEIFKRAVENVKPIVEVRSRRVGGATYQVPMEVRPERRTSLAIRWIIVNARERNAHSMQEKLAEEVWDAYNGSGGAIRKREDVHRMAEANKAFAHYRW